MGQNATDTGRALSDFSRHSETRGQRLSEPGRSLAKDLRWAKGAQTLYYRVGGLQLGAWEFESYLALSSFLKLSENVPPPDWSEVPAGCEAIVFPGVPVSSDLPRMTLKDGYIRYVPRYEDRSFIRIEGSYEDYLKRFSAKSRNTLRRHLRRYSDAVGGEIDWRFFTTTDEMDQFRDLAIRISRRSHLHASGHGLPETAEFQRELRSEAEKGRACGYILFFKDRPAAYAYCKLDSSTLLYSAAGFDAELGEHSPGRILLLLILQHLFEKGSVEFFDFGGQEYSYKSFFGTDTVRCARVLFLPVTIRNGALVLLHMLTEGAWRMLSSLKQVLKRSR